MAKHKIREYKDAPWKEDKVKCVVTLKKTNEQGERIENSVLKVFVTRDTSKDMPSEAIKEKLPIAERFKYNLANDIKMSIPKRVFMQFLKHPNVDNYFITRTRGKANLIAEDLNTGIKKEQWYDSDGTSCILYFRDGHLLHYEKG